MCGAPTKSFANLLSWRVSISVLVSPKTSATIRLSGVASASSIRTAFPSNLPSTNFMFSLSYIGSSVFLFTMRPKIPVSNPRAHFFNPERNTIDCPLFCQTLLSPPGLTQEHYPNVGVQVLSASVFPSRFSPRSRISSFDALAADACIHSQTSRMGQRNIAPDSKIHRASPKDDGTWDTSPSTSASLHLRYVGHDPMIV